MLYVSISEGNMKLRDVPSVSLLPGHACKPGVPCLKQCYAKKTCVSYPSVGRAWAGNYVLATTDRASYFAQIRKWLDKKRPKYFRWHVGGDILDDGYLAEMRNIAAERPATRFMAYTKRDELGFSGIPENLTVIVSRWKGDRIKDVQGRPQAWMHDKANVDTRIPEKHLACPGTCDTCGHKCWFLKSGDSVVFHKH